MIRFVGLPFTNGAYRKLEVDFEFDFEVVLLTAVECSGLIIGL